MKIKDGGAAISVDQATESGEELAKIIIELILMILEQMRDSRDDSDTGQELKKELQSIKLQLTILMRKNQLLAEDSDLDNIILSPAEKVYGKNCTLFNIKEYKLDEIHRKIKNNQTEITNNNLNF